MATATATPPSFALFTNLPRELREQIWRETLPTDSGSTLFPYRKGCWTVRDPAKGETGFEPGFPDHLELLFLYESLDKLHFDIPIFFVNSEARDIATTWLREKGLEVKVYPGPVPGHQQPWCTFARTFRPHRDILYVPDGKSADFHSEPIDCITQPKYDGYNYNTTCEVSRLAISETLFTEGIFLEELLQFWNYRVKELFIIVGPQPEEAWTDSEDSMLARWELESWNGGSYRWTNDSWEINVENREPIDKTRSLQKVMEDTVKYLADFDGLHGYAQELSIRLVRAVQR
jgi:hypothetical protein